MVMGPVAGIPWKLCGLDSSLPCRRSVAAARRLPTLGSPPSLLCSCLSWTFLDPLCRGAVLFDLALDGLLDSRSPQASLDLRCFDSNLSHGSHHGRTSTSRLDSPTRSPKPCHALQHG